MSTDNFPEFSKMVHKNIDAMMKHEMFVLDIEPQEVWDMYLAAFPEGTNPIFRERTEHDCSCCRGFLKTMGNVVTITSGGGIRSMWDGGSVFPHPYESVAKKIRAALKDIPIRTIFRHRESKVGAASTIEQLDCCNTIKWNHYHCELNNKFVSRDIRSFQGPIETNIGVMRRGLEEINPYALDTVIELCEQGSLYRGDQYIKDIKKFKVAQNLCGALDEIRKDRYLWSVHREMYLLLRNTAIGTLLVALSDGEELDSAVASYESMVAPSNYRRSSALITKGMVSKALKKIEDLGLRDAIDRRYAVASDVSVRDVLFVNRSTAPVMRDSLEDTLMASTTAKPVSSKGGNKISISEFMRDVAPEAKKIEVLFDGSKLENLVSLTAPQNKDVGRLFKWGNTFAWSYRGNLADSIKERVKRAGGKVDGVGRISLSWKNHDDLDIHVTCPGGQHVYYGNKRPKGVGCALDVDMNVSMPVRDAVENVVWSTKMPAGTYVVKVNNFLKRESHGVGFEIEVEIAGERHIFHSSKSPIDNGDILVCKITVAIDGSISNIDLSPGITRGQTQSEEWGLKTGEFYETEMITLSPNFWSGEEIGNKHWFFILASCTNPESTRGIYNEFLRSELMEHRKVFEVLGSKTMCPPSDQQLSGLGFSSTIRNSLTVKVDNGKMYEVQF